MSKKKEIRDKLVRNSHPRNTDRGKAHIMVSIHKRVTGESFQLPAKALQPLWLSEESLMPWRALRQYSMASNSRWPCSDVEYFWPS